MGIFLKSFYCFIVPQIGGEESGIAHHRSFFVKKVCVLLRETRRRWLSEDGIRFFPPCPRFGGVFSIVGGRVEICLRRISWDSVGVCFRWIHVDLVFIRLCSCVHMLDFSDLRFSSSAAVAILPRLSYGALTRRLSDCLLQQGLPGSDEAGRRRWRAFGSLQC